MEAEELLATNQESLVSEPELNKQQIPHQNSQEQEGEVGSGESQLSSFDQKEIMRALEVVERDSVAIAERFTPLFSSLLFVLRSLRLLGVWLITCIASVMLPGTFKNVHLMPQQKEINT